MTRMKKFLLTTIVVASLVMAQLSIANAVTVSVDGGSWNYGLATQLGFIWDYSYYYHPSKAHYSNAMINGMYSGRKNANAGQTSCADSPKVDIITGATTWNSYYGFN
ncbi:MAG: lactococcin 972 family bacteriocin [Clostridia bacterium]|nr:lactococcin 972 family bacteriocin [Clostridia bacterium]